MLNAQSLSIHYLQWLLMHDASIITALLLDTFQLQVKCLNVCQLLLHSLPQTVRLCNAHEVASLLLLKRGYLLLSREPLHLSVVFVSWFSAVLSPPVMLFSSTLHHSPLCRASPSSKLSISDELL